MVKIVHKQPKGEILNVFPHYDFLMAIRYWGNICRHCGKQVDIPKIEWDVEIIECEGYKVKKHSNPRLVCPYCKGTITHVSYVDIDIPLC